MRAVTASAVGLDSPADRIARLLAYQRRAWALAEKLNNAAERARTYPGIAAAMASQWGQP